MGTIKTAILAIDAATGPCSAAIWKDGRIAAYAENRQPVMQSASLMPLVEQVLKESGVGYDALAAVAATVGPGSFTGIRVALAAARGIAYAASIPEMGFTTLQVLAYAAEIKPVLAILNAGKGEYYYQPYGSDGQALSEAQLGLPDAATTGLASASVGNIELPGLTPLPVTFPRADALAMLAAKKATPALSLKPFYIRAPDAKLPAKKA